MSCALQYHNGFTKQPSDDILKRPTNDNNIPKDHVKIVFEQMQLIMPKKDIEEQWSRLKEYMDVYLRHHAIPMIYNTK
ncbi:MAG: hypothetical protein WAM14_01455 [Candidatus Nitrosopolaris sp.]